MKIPFRQGIVRYQTDMVGSPSFLQKSNGGSNVDLIASDTSTLINLAHLDTDYLYEETRTVNGAWGPFQVGSDYWLYWDIDLLTAARTFGFTALPPAFGPAAPVNPQRDQHWFDTINTVMNVWTGFKWATRARVFSCKYESGSIIIPYTPGSQVGISDTCDSGFILFDDNDDPVRKVQKGGITKFLTTESNFITHSSKLSNVVLESSKRIAKAVESIPAFYLVSYKGLDQIGLASYNDTLHPAVGLVQEDMGATEVGSFILSGYVTNPAWNWTQPSATPVFCGLTGEITTTVPQIGSIQQVGTIVDSNTVLINIGPQIILMDA